MVKMTDTDKKEVFLADLYYGMSERTVTYELEKIQAIDEMINELHEYNRNA
jgi:hypothetical protein